MSHHLRSAARPAPLLLFLLLLTVGAPLGAQPSACPSPDFCCGAAPDVRTQGFWRRQCTGPHPSGEDARLDSYAGCVDDTVAFAALAGRDDLCAELHPDPKNDKCEQARAQFLALLLNVCSGRLRTCDGVDDPDLGLSRVEDVIGILDALLSSGAFRDCVLVQAVADRINRGVTISPPPPALLAGCSDGEREGFVDATTHPDVAGCSGGWSVPGILGATRAPACGLAAGDDGGNPSGAGCNAGDLCATGWHVCESVEEVDRLSPTGCAGAAPTGETLFFATRQSSNGCAVCATGARLDPDCDGSTCTGGCCQTDLTANDVFGCGSLGSPLGNASCGVLDRFSNNACTALPSPWSCAGHNTLNEALFVRKAGPDSGGVLCCRDCPSAGP